MKIVKLNHPQSWLLHGHWGYENHFPDNNGVWGEYKFEINNACSECDFWVIHESLDKPQYVLCPPQNVIYVTSEEKPQVAHYDKNYLAQFGTVITSRDDIEHPKVIRTYYLNPWRVYKTYNQISNAAIKKDCLLSAIISNNVQNEGHLKRYAFINKLKGHFKDRLDWFCKGERNITDKWDGLAPFKYSIAIENSSLDFYFTEKILDCFLAESLPFYYGCPNLEAYFPAESFIRLDLNDYLGAIEIIEKAIKENYYENNLQYIKTAKELALKKYQFIPAIVDILDEFCSNNSPKRQTKVLPKSAFGPWGNSFGKKMKYFLMNTVGWKK